MIYKDVETGYIKIKDIEFITVVGEMLPKEKVNPDEVPPEEVEQFSVSALTMGNEIRISPFYNTWGEAKAFLMKFVAEIESVMGDN